MNAFDKVIGYKATKRELLQLCDMLRNREIYEEMGARLPHGLLLYGDPGLGKTLLARCFVEESGLHTITVRRDKGGDAFIDGITQAFASAKTKAPSIVLLDDMDKFANEDDTHCDAPEYAAVQAGIDDVKDAGVFVIATANDIRKLPSSLRRSGRFDRKIGLRAPTVSDAEEIITHYLKTKRVSDSVNMEDLTRMMRYNSCAELETILNEAAVRAAFARKTGIDMEDMVSVVLKQQYGAQEDMPRVSDEVIEKVALHEAGHLVVCEALCPGGVGFASLLPSDENRCGGFIHCCKGVSDSQSAIIALGGKAAVEMRYAGQVAEGCSDDIARAVNCIREAAAKEGTLGFSLLNVESDSSSNMSESLNARSEAAVQAELERYYGKARALLAQNEAFLKEITEALVMKKTLLYSDIQAIRGTAVKRNPAVTCEAASRYDAAEIENSPPEDPEEAIRQKIMRKLEEAERRRCS